MKILVLGDVGASATNCQAFCSGEENLFSPELQKMCADADVVLLNLEKPLTDAITPLDKCPPDYHAPTKTINGIKLLHPTAVTLANNHIMDQREQGLHSTINILNQNNIQYVGAGNNRREAKRPTIIEKAGHRIGIYACCEKEFSFATDCSAGANIFDPLESLDDIFELKQECDYLIVLHHGGMQDYPYPTPNQQKVCRKMCDKGADLVVCQHSHIIGCEEKYGNGTIVYGQGNFLLDDAPIESWQSGIIVEITIEQDKASISYIPTQANDHKAIIHPEPEGIRRAFAERSLEIERPDVVITKFTEFSEKKLSPYLMKLSGKNELIQRIFGRIGVAKRYSRLYSKSAAYRILDYLYCDSHREAIEFGLEQFVQKKNSSKT